MATFGAYTLHEQLGTGMRGTVHRATVVGDDGDEHSVAVKRISRQLVATPEESGRFGRQIERAARLTHPNIVRVHRAGHFEDTAYVEMELVRGTTVERTLGEIDSGEVPPWSVVVSLLCELCSALEFAHGRGVVHGDIAPSHLLVEASGRLKVLGFGAPAVGMSRYVAPETLDGSNPDERADLFSAAMIAHELLTGRPMYGAGVAPPSRFNPTCPEALDEIIVRAVSRLPAQRWQKAADLRSALHTVGGVDHGLVAAWVRGDLPSDKLPRTIAFPLRATDEPAAPPRVARGTARLPTPEEATDPTVPTAAMSIHNVATDLRDPVDDFDIDLETDLELDEGPIAPVPIAMSTSLRPARRSRRVELAIAFGLGALAMLVVMKLMG